MAKTLPEYERRILAPLGDLGGRLRRCLLISGVAATLLAVLAGAGLSLLIDWTVHLQKDMRATMLVLMILGLGFVVFKQVLIPLRLQLRPFNIALMVEHRFPELRSLLISAVRFHDGQVGRGDANSPELMRVVIDRASRAVRMVQVNDVLDRTASRRSAGICVLVGLISWVALAALPGTVGTWFERCILLTDTAWPQRTRLVLDLPSDVLRGAIGDDLEVRAYVPEGYEVPRLVNIHFEFQRGRAGHEPMVRVGDRSFRYTFTQAKENFEFHLRGGDDQTEVVRAELVERPAVAALTMTITPPPYTGQPQFETKSEVRSADLLPGSVLAIAFKPNKPILSAALLSDAGLEFPATQAKGTWHVQCEPERSDSYHFKLTDVLGLENKRPIRLSIRMIKDVAPHVRMRVPGLGTMVTAGALLPMEIGVADDYGIKEISLAHQIQREGEQTNAIELPGLIPGTRLYERQHEFSVSSCSVIVGDRLTIFVESSDLDDVNGPNIGASAAISLRVVSAEELLSQLARQEREFRRQFMRLVDDQEEIRRVLLSSVSQWNGKPDDGEAIAGFASAERRQRLVGSQVNALRQQFEQVLMQLRINGLETPDVRSRLTKGVITPLTQLSKRDLPEATDAIHSLMREGEPELARTIDSQQVEILDRMRLTLANMLKWEGFQETITLLRDIIRLQTELNKETQDEIEQQLDDIFGDD